MSQVVLNLVGIPSSMVIWRHLPTWPLVPLQLAAIGASVTLGAFVLLRRRSWTVGAARAAFFVGIGVLFPMLWAAEAELAGQGVPWAPFEAHRLSMLTAALIAPAEVVVGALGVLGFLGLALGQWAAFTPAEHRIAVGPEPAPSVIYALFALILLEHRVRQLRSERSAAEVRMASLALERFGRFALAVRDRTGAPLQVLSLDLHVLARKAPELAGIVERMSLAVSRLQGLTDLLDRQGRTVPWSKDTESFDAEQVIERLGESDDGAR